MTGASFLVKKELLENCIRWFQDDFRRRIISLIENHFPGYQLPSGTRSVLDRLDRIKPVVARHTESVDIARFFQVELAQEPGDSTLMKEMMLQYRRDLAAKTEALRGKTFHLELIQTVEEGVACLDAVAKEEWFERIESLRLPRAKDFLPVQLIEQSEVQQSELAPRLYDEKFHMLQSPALFLNDLAYFRGRCEIRDKALAVAFMDIDDFKKLNTAHSETKVDRQLLPRFMQTIESHVYQHGFAYRQGGEEYLLLLPNLSRPLAIAFLEELRQELAGLDYPEISEKTTVSIGVCVADPDCPLTDRELRDRANLAEKFAKGHGKNCIAAFRGRRFTQDELYVAKP